MSFRLNKLTFYTPDDLPQGSDKWQLFRRDKITASNAYRLLTKGKNAAILENRRPTFDNVYTDRGHALEAEVRERLNELIKDNGYVIKEFGSIMNDDYPDCSYSPDGIMFPTNLKTLSWDEWKKIPLVEIKSYNDVTIGKDGTPHIVNKHLKCAKDINNVPINAIVQMQFGMMIAERDLCYLVLYNPDCVEPEYRIKIWTVNRDEAIINRLKEKING